MVLVADPISVPGGWVGGEALDPSPSAFSIPAGHAVQIDVTDSNGNPTTTGEGSFLVVTAAWRAMPNAPDTTVVVGDDAANWWEPVGTSPGNATVRCAIWVAANARPARHISVTPLGQQTGIAVVVRELAGTDLPTWVTVDSLATAYQAATTSLPLPVSPTQNCLVLAAVAADTSDFAAINSTPWAIDDFNWAESNGADTTSDIIIAGQFETSSTTADPGWNTTTALDMGGVTVAIQLTPVEPVQPNPNWPYVRFEAAFGSSMTTPLDEMTWTDITDRLLQMQGTRGRSYELDALQSANMNFVLRNDDGALTPLNTSSPYYPNVKVYTPIRLWARWNKRVYGIYAGYMERWPQSWNDPHFGVVNAVGVDGWATLVASLPSTLRGEILQDHPVGYWPCSDPQGSTTAVNVVGNNAVPLTQTVSGNGAGPTTAAFGDGSIAGNTVIGDSGSNWAMSGLPAGGSDANGYTLVYDGPPLPSIADGITVNFFARVDSNVTNGESFIFSSFVPGRPICIVAMDAASGKAELVCYNADSGGVGTGVLSQNQYYGASEAAMYTLVLDATSAKLYINAGVPEPALSVTGLTLPTDWSLFAMDGLAGQVAIQFGSQSHGNMAISHVAVFPYKASQFRINAWYNAGIYGSQQDAVDWRIARILSYTTWAGPRRIMYSSGGFFGPALDISGQAPGSAVTGAVGTDAGLLYVDRNGYVAYRSRLHVRDRGVQYILGDGTGEVPYRGDVQMDYDPQYVANDVQVQQASVGNGTLGATAQVQGPVVYATDQQSIDAYGDRSLSRTSYFSDVTDTTDLANWLLNLYKQPKLRVQSVAVNPAANPALWEKILGTDIGDYLTLNRRPVGAAEMSTTVEVIGVNPTIDFASGQWLMQLNLAPLSTLQPLVLDDPVLGELDDGYVAGW